MLRSTYFYNMNTLSNLKNYSLSRDNGIAYVINLFNQRFHLFIRRFQSVNRPFNHVHILDRAYLIVVVVARKISSTTFHRLRKPGLIECTRMSIIMWKAYLIFSANQRKNGLIYHKIIFYKITKDSIWVKEVFWYNMLWLLSISFRWFYLFIENEKRAYETNHHCWYIPPWKKKRIGWKLYAYNIVIKPKAQCNTPCLRIVRNYYRCL